MWCQSNNTTPRIKHKLYDLFFLNKIASSACKTKKLYLSLQCQKRNGRFV